MVPESNCLGWSFLTCQYPSEVSRAKGLSTLTYEQPTQLVALRNAFKSAGFREQERQITFALNSIELAKSWDDAFRYLLFELTSDWGMSPGRPLRIFAALVVLMSLGYMAALGRAEKSPHIWKVYDPSMVLSEAIDKGLAEPVRPSALTLWPWSLYFSLLSAFHIGWRDLNVGNWMSRMQLSEYSLRADGWVRTISGVQSLVSVYLLALWVLVYFGRPFE